MKKIIFTSLAIISLSSVFALDWDNSFSLLNNFQRNLNNPYYKPYYNNYNRYNSKFLRPVYQGLTGYSVPVSSALPKCETNSYYVDNKGILSCRHEATGYTTVKIINND